jgi:hypothetical protein
MGLVLLIVGLIAVCGGFYMLRSPKPGDIPTPSSPTKPLLYLLAIGIALFAVWCLVMFINSVQNQAMFALFLGLMILSIILSKKLFTFASEADERHAKNMKAHAEAMQGRVAHQRSLVELENARQNAIKEQILRDEAMKTQLREQQVKRTHLSVSEEEAELRRDVIPVARQSGLSVDDVREVNKHKYKTKIDLQRRWEETEQDLIAADFADSSQQRQVLAERRAELEELIRKRSSVDKEEQDDYVKQKLLARYDKDIANLEDAIDARQARLVLPEVGKENRRLS